MAKRHWRWLLAVGLTLLLHFAWEMGHAGFFADFEGVPWWRHAPRCLQAAGGDVLIAAAAWLAATLVFRRPEWPLERTWIAPAAVWIGFGIAVTVGLERWALGAGRWRYDHGMPILLGIGLLPLLQWVVVPALSLMMVRLLALRHGRPGFTAGSA